MTERRDLRGGASRFLSGIAGQAFELRGGMRDTARSLGACVVLGLFGLVILKLFQVVGIWVVVAVCWVGIAGFLWRYRANMRFDRLREAIREDAGEARPPAAGVPRGPREEP